jgi:hypothetical protein
MAGRMWILLLGLLCGLLPAARVEAQDEIPLRYIELIGPAADANAELSGLAWSGDTLLLLAENPNRYAADGSAGMFFALDKAAILAYLEADDPAPLEPRPVPLIGPGITSLAGFDGFEAAVFMGDRAFLVIEARLDDGTTFGYLVGGTADPGLSAITLDLAHIVELPSQTDWRNMGYEGVFVAGETIGVIYEANGAGVNPNPRALWFDADLNPLGETDFPPVPFRVTDVAADSDGIYWAMNERFPGFGPDEDDLAALQATEGPTHRLFPQTERLLAFTIQAETRLITLADRTPVYLKLAGPLPRNWEGLARLDDRGFLLVTDEFPLVAVGVCGGLASPPDPLSTAWRGEDDHKHFERNSG